MVLAKFKFTSHFKMVDRVEFHKNSRSMKLFIYLTWIVVNVCKFNNTLFVKID